MKAIHYIRSQKHSFCRHYLWRPARFCIRTFNIFNLYKSPPERFEFFRSIMFTVDTNLFFSNNEIVTLFSIVNIELQKVSLCFTAKSLSLNVTKTKYPLFHKKSVKDSVPSKLLDLKIANSSIKRTSSIKFLEVMIN